MSKNPSYRVFDKGCIRVAATPIEAYFEWSKACAESAEQGYQFLIDFFAEHANNEALYAASPSLWSRHEEAFKGTLTAERREKLAISLSSYFSRMCSRSTPFGTFAAVGGVKVDQAAPFLLDVSSWRQVARLDSEVLYALARHLAGKYARHDGLKYQPNSSLVRIGRNVRYYETVHQKNGAVHKLVNIAVSEPLEAALSFLASSGSCSFAGLVGHLAETYGEEHRTEIDGFVSELVDSQVLVSGLTLPITSHVGIGEWLVNAVKPIDAPMAKRLSALLDECRALNSRTKPLHLVAQSLKDRLAEFLEHSPKNLVQVDQLMPACVGSLPTDLANDVNDALRLSRLLAGEEPRNSLDKFRDDFVARYGTHFVPILQALDEECGLGFNNSATPDIGVLADLQWTSEKGEVASGSVADLILSVFQSTLNAEEIDLSHYVDRLQPRALVDRLPETSSIIAQLHSKSEADFLAGNYLVEFAGGGACGAILLSRFAYASEFLRSATQELAEVEQERHSAVLAELVYQPSERMANISVRPPVREYEIELLAQSGAAGDKRLSLADVLLGVVGGRVVLWSKTLNREILVRHTTAYNSSLGRNLGVFQLLCLLQWQNRVMRLDFSPLLSLRARHTPRVVFRRVLVCRASWTLEAADIAQAQSNPDARLAVKYLRREYGLPQFVLVGGGDNKIVVDLNNGYACKDFLKRAKEGTLRVEEAFPRDLEPWVRSEKGRHTAEFVLPLVREGSPAFEPEVRPADVVLAGPVFQPGSDWLSIKIYSGTPTRERIAAEILPTIVANLAENQQWFFLRYSDPTTHLRLRVRHADATSVLKELQSKIEALMGAEYIHRIELDTYIPETYRYGGPEAVLIAERIFHEDSLTALAFLGGGRRDATERLGYCVATTLMYLEWFGYPLVEQRALLREMQDDMYRALSTSAATRGDVGQLYRKMRTQLAGFAENPELFLGDMEQRLQPLASKLGTLAGEGKLTVSQSSVVRSLIHMSINRVLTAYSREQEAVVYDLLHRHLMAVMEQRKSKEVVSA